MKTYQTTRAAFSQIVPVTHNSVEHVGGLAKSLLDAHPFHQITVILVNSYPEDCAILNEIHGLNVVPIEFGASEAGLDFQLNWTIRQLKFACELGQHHIVLIDSVDRLHRALGRRFSNPDVRLASIFKLAGSTGDGSLQVIGLCDSDSTIPQIQALARPALSTESGSTRTRVYPLTAALAA